MKSLALEVCDALNPTRHRPDKEWFGASRRYPKRALCGQILLPEYWNAKWARTNEDWNDCPECFRIP